jgi:IclR family transcriptional regulator, acetate operon repressor
VGSSQNLPNILSIFIVEQPRMSKEGPVKQVKSAIRTISLFKVFAEVKRPLSLAELSEAMAAPKSSCYELIQTLVQLGYMFALDDGKVYYPSRRLYEMAEQINTFNPIKVKMQEGLRGLRDKTGETVVIGRFQGNQVVYTEVFDGTHTIRYTASAGDLNAVHASALGKALLGALEEKARDKLIGELKLARYNEHTITKKAELKDNLASCQVEGVYTDSGEHLSDVMGMALPLKVQGYPLAVGIVGPIPRMKENFARYCQTLLATVAVLQD